MEKIIKIETVDDRLILHFGTINNSINAYTLASSIVDFADSLKEINKQINPGYEVEIVIDSLESGSFKVIIRTIYTELQNLFSKENIRNVILTILTTILIEKCIIPDPEINIIVNDNNVIVERGNEKIIVPRDIYDEAQNIKKNPNVNRSIGKAFKTIDEDTSIEYLGVTDQIDDEPNIIIDRSNFSKLYSDIQIDEENENNRKQIDEFAELYIYRPYLEKNKKNWVFFWRGEKILAPILDDSFFSNFLEHKIELGVGDKIKVRLRIYQKKDENSGIFITYKYSVVEVLEYIKREDNTELCL